MEFNPTSAKYRKIRRFKKRVYILQHVIPVGILFEIRSQEVFVVNHKSI
jgi:hypothetical protein